MKGSFKCPECGETELTSAYFFSSAYGEALRGTFGNAFCFGCGAGMVGTKEDIAEFNQKIEQLWIKNTSKKEDKRYG